LDGNPVPMLVTVPVLWIGTAERVSAIVDMNHPGVWVMGDLADDDRKKGMGNGTSMKTRTHFTHRIDMWTRTATPLSST
jgi:hypothetical protein